MSAPNPYTSARILETGKKEFLEKGFEGASMRQIASKAGVTTGAIYGYFPDKAALFQALVEEAAEGLMDFFVKTQQDFDSLPPEHKVAHMRETTNHATDEMMDYIYAHLDAFKLIICASAGTVYVDYVDRLVAVEETYTHRFIEAMRLTGCEVKPISPAVVHILCSANYHGMFEVVAHDIPKEQALAHTAMLVEFYQAGWNQLLGL